MLNLRHVTSARIFSGLMSPVLAALQLWQGLTAVRDQSVSAQRYEEQCALKPSSDPMAGPKIRAVPGPEDRAPRRDRGAVVPRAGRRCLR
jgi:hypothetical protein